MDRRRFLKWLTAGAAAAVIDPEQLLWVPGKKTIFLPPAVVLPNWEIVSQDQFGILRRMTIPADAFKDLFNPPPDVIRCFREQPLMTTGIAWYYDPSRMYGSTSFS